MLMWVGRLVALDKLVLIKARSPTNYCSNITKKQDRARWSNSLARDELVFTSFVDIEGGWIIWKTC